MQKSPPEHFYSGGCSFWSGNLFKIAEEFHFVIAVGGENLGILIADQAGDAEVFLHGVFQIVLIPLGRKHQHRVFALLQRVFKQPELILITNLHLTYTSFIH